MRTLNNFTLYVISLSFLYSFSQVGSIKIDLDPKLKKVIEEQDDKNLQDELFSKLESFEADKQKKIIN